MSALLLQVLTPLSLHLLAVSLSSFILAVSVSIRGARVFEKTLVHEFLISYGQTEWNKLFSKVEIVLWPKFAYQKKIKLNWAKLIQCEIFNAYELSITVFTLYGLTDLCINSWGSSAERDCKLELQLNRRDFFFSARCPYFHFYSFLLSFLFCFFILFQPCCFSAQVFGRPLVHEFHTFYSHI